MVLSSCFTNSVIGSAFSPLPFPSISSLFSSPEPRLQLRLHGRIISVLGIFSDNLGKAREHASFGVSPRNCFSFAFLHYKSPIYISYDDH